LGIFAVASAHPYIATGAIAQPYHKAAKAIGIEPKQAQALAWMSNLNVKSGPETFASSFEARLRMTAEARGIDPDKLFTEVVNGRATLMGGAAAVGAGAPLGPFQDGEPVMHDKEDT
jgi:hypothetical protein